MDDIHPTPGVVDTRLCPMPQETRPKAILRIRVSRVSIGTFFGVYASLPLTLTWFCRPRRLAISLSSLRGEFRVLDLS